MPAEDKKATILPCNYSMKSTWAALRKCWLGFDISLSNNDREKMSEYASRIRKLQRQLGIDATNFDPDILSEESAKQPCTRLSIDGSCLEERELDYDGLLTNPLLEQENHDEPISPPRKSIFTTYRSRI
ncbi:MAG TPA: hypothetical protein VF884_00675 [Nitrososphaeraceae archaeon]